MNEEKREQITSLSIALLIILVILIFVWFLYNQGFFISEQSLLKYLIESQYLTIYSAERVRDMTTNMQLKRIVSDYIQKEKEDIRNFRIELKKITQLDELSTQY